MNDLIVYEKHYVKISRDFVSFLNGSNTKNIQAMCKKANEFLELKKANYKTSTLPIIRTGLKKTILNSLGNNQYNPVHIQALDSIFRSLCPPITLDKSVKKEKYLKRYEVEQLMKYCTKRMESIIRFLFFTGCRVNEMTNLRLKDCKINNNSVCLDILGKRKKQRFLNIPLKLFNEIKGFFQGKTYLFETRNHTKYNNSCVYVQIRDQAKKKKGTYSLNSGDSL